MLETSQFTTTLPCSVIVLSVANSDVRIYNAALNRPAYMSSQYVSSYHRGFFNASLANDGIRETNAVRNREAWCAHSAVETHPWWAVDLGRPMTIIRVNLTNRGDAAGRHSVALITLE